VTVRSVLTGDLIRSTHLSDAGLNDARQTALSAATQLSTWEKGLLGAQPEFFRGDSWQVLLMRPGFFLRAAILMRAKLRSANDAWDTRIAVGIGEVSRIDRNRTSLSSGEAFLLSGQALDRMGVNTRLVVATPNGLWRTLDPLAQMCSAIMDDWTSKQAEIASLALAPAPSMQSEIAERLGISQQAVSKALSAAKVGAVLRACSVVEGLSWNHVRLM